jgi:hypothetical protein
MRWISSQAVQNPAFSSLFDHAQCGNPLDLSHGVRISTGMANSKPEIYFFGGYANNPSIKDDDVFAIFHAHT